MVWSIDHPKRENEKRLVNGEGCPMPNFTNASFDTLCILTVRQSYL